MARKPLTYWEKRQTQLMQMIEKRTEPTIKSLVNAYNQATRDINKEIAKTYKNYGKDNNLPKEALEHLLNTRETKTHYNNLLKVIKNNIKNEEIKNKMIAKYNAPAYSYRISRLQALQDNIDLELKKVADQEQSITKTRYIDTLKTGYYRNLYDIQKGTGIGFDFAKIDDKEIKMLLNEKWTNKANFSQRIWNNSEKLGNYLQTQLTSAELSGQSIQKTSRNLADYMNVGIGMATRLVRTEVNHFANEAEMLSYQECGVEKYQFIATLDKRTCVHCAKLDKQVFNVKDRKVGINFPPVHANDRCTTVAYFDDDVTEGLKRRARDENETNIEVAQDMRYDEWKTKFIDLTFEQRGAIKDYSSSKSYMINYKLRENEKLTSEDKKFIDNLDGGLDKLQNYKKTTYRQIGFDMLGKNAYNEFINYHKNNNIIYYSQYTSTSKNYNDYEIEDSLKVEITIEGKTGKDIRGLAGIEDENEVLFKRNVPFEVIKVKDNKIWLKEV